MEESNNFVNRKPKWEQNPIRHFPELPQQKVYQPMYEITKNSYPKLGNGEKGERGPNT